MLWRAAAEEPPALSQGLPSPLRIPAPRAMGLIPSGERPALWPEGPAALPGAWRGAQCFLTMRTVQVMVTPAMRPWVMVSAL